jgi:hypothetical protein
MILPMAFGEIYEYRDVIFYPNGSQTVGISKLYINYTDTEAFNIYIFYRNITANLPYPKTVVVDLPQQKFNISIVISAKRVKIDEWEVYYKIINNYPYDILFNVTFPDGFSAKNLSILIPANSERTITLSKTLYSNTLHFGESNITFEVPAVVKIIYSTSIPFSIIKSNRILDNGSVEWEAIYIIKNNKPFPLNVTAFYWGELDNKKVVFGNYSYTLNPNQNVTERFFIISDKIPIFYIKIYTWREIYKNITIKPALKVDNSYIIGKAVVKDAKFSMEYVRKHAHIIQPNINQEIKEEESKKEEKKEESKQKSNTARTSGGGNHRGRETIYKFSNTKNETQTSQNDMRMIMFPLIIKKAKESKIKYNESNNITINETKDKKPLDKREIIITVTVTTAPMLSLTIAIPLLFKRRPKMAGRRLLFDKFLHKPIYAPEGCKLGKLLPNEVTIVKLTEDEKELARDLHEIYDIPLNSAKAIVLGVKYGGKVFLSDKKAYDLAVKIGLDAELI